MPDVDHNQNVLKAVDFFCGAGGMSYGLHRAGIKILGGVDVDSDCKQTFEKNIPGATCLCDDITGLTEATLAKNFGLQSGDANLIFCGCSPCQFWSKVNTDRTNNKKTAFLLQHFERFIAHFLPGYVIVENVPGLLNRKKESILPQFLEFLTSKGYTFKDGIVDASCFGVPQHRRRYLLLASRVAKIVTLPKGRRNSTLTVRRFIGPTVGLKELAAGEKDKKDTLHIAAALKPQNLKRIKQTPNDGGDRSSWRRDSELQLKAYKGKDDIFRDVYGRMFWDRKASTITTRFNSLSNGRFGHPDQDRAITLREGALLQTFPKRFKFHGSNQFSLARQIGNAVPPEMALRIGRHVKKLAANG